MTRETEAARILRERARALARPGAPAVAAEQLEVLEFRVGDERYALETRDVQEVYPLRELLPLPGTPPFILGVVNVRGRIVPVFDLRKFFDLPAQGVTDLHQIVLVGGPDLEFGLLADAAVGVRSIPRDSVQPSLPTLTGIRSDYLAGVTAERLIILDAARLLADPRIIVDEEVS